MNFRCQRGDEFHTSMTFMVTAMQVNTKKQRKQRNKTDSPDESSVPALIAGEEQQITPISITEEQAVINLRVLDSLRPHKLEAFGQRYRLICLLQGGLSVKMAIERLQIKCSESAVRKLYKRFKESGLSALLDGRWIIKHEKRVFTSQVQHLTLQWYFARPAAGPHAIWKQVVKVCVERGWHPPSYETIKKFIASLPEDYKRFRAGKVGRKEWSQQSRPVVLFDNSSFSNERWQADHHDLKIWVKELVNDQWEPCQAYISAYIDDFSRSIPSFEVSTKNPDAWTTSLLLMRAVLPKNNAKWYNKGLPRIIQSDNDSTFMADAVISIMGRLGIQPDPIPRHYPDSDGKIERWFQTLEEFLRILPGHKDAIGHSIGAARKHMNVLLTVSQLRREIEWWIVEDYNQHVHSSTGRKPAELWEETVCLLMPEDEDAFHLCLLKDDKVRTVKNTGVKFCLPGTSKKYPKDRYWAPILAFYAKRRVRVCYNPEDRMSVILRCADTDKIICEAWLMNIPEARYTIEDVKRARNQYRRGLVERLKAYRREVDEGDRRKSKQGEWDEARRLAKAQAAMLKSQEIDSQPDDPSEKEVEALLALFERQAAGLE